MKWLRWTWEDVYWAAIRRGYDPVFCMWIADRWDARRKRESRRRRSAAHKGKPKRRPNVPDEWLTIREAAAIIGCSFQNVNQRVRNGTLADLLPATVEAYAEHRRANGGHSRPVRRMSPKTRKVS